VTPGVLIGHDCVQVYPVASGWRLRCECGEEFRGVRQYVVTDRWYAHRDEVAEERGLG
jgi:hypothetical protein